MAGSEEHFVGSLIFNIDLDDEASFDFVTSAIRKMAESQLLRVLDEVCSALAPGEETIRIPRLEVDLGQFEIEGLDGALLNEFAEVFIRELSKVLELPETRIEHLPAPTSMTPADRLLKLITHFVRYGYRPWWAAPDKPPLESALQEIIRVRSQPTRSMVLREGRVPESRTRIIYSFSDPTLYSLFAILAPQPESFYKDYVEEFHIVHRAERVVREEDRKFRKVIQELILMYLIDLRKSGINQVELLDFQMRRMSARYQIPYRVLLRRFRDAVRRLTGSLLPEKGVLKPLAESLFVREFPEEAAELPLEEARHEMAVESGAVRHLQDLFLRGSTSLPVRLRVHQDKDRFLRWMITEREPVFKRILFKLGRDALVRRRILAIFREESIRAVFESLAPGKLELIYAAFELFEVVRDDPRPVQQERVAFRKSVQAIALEILIEQEGSRLSDQRYIDALLAQYARQYRIEHRRLLSLLLADLEQRSVLSAGLQLLQRTLLTIDSASDTTATQYSSRYGVAADTWQRQERADATRMVSAVSVNSLIAALSGQIEGARLVELIVSLLELLRRGGIVWGEIPSAGFIQALLTRQQAVQSGENRLSAVLDVLASLLSINRDRLASHLESSLKADMLRIAPDSGLQFETFLQGLKRGEQAKLPLIVQWLEYLRPSVAEAAAILVHHRISPNLQPSLAKRLLTVISPEVLELVGLLEPYIQYAFPKAGEAAETFQQYLVAAVRAAIGAVGPGGVSVQRTADLLISRFRTLSGRKAVEQVADALRKEQKSGEAVKALLHAARAAPDSKKTRKTGRQERSSGGALHRQLNISYLLELWGEEEWSQLTSLSPDSPADELLRALLEEAPEAFRIFLMRHRFSEILPVILAEHLPDALWADLLPILHPEEPEVIQHIEQTFLYWYRTYRVVRMPASVFRPFVRQHVLAYIMRVGSHRFDSRAAIVHVYDTLYRQGKLDLQESARIPAAVYLTDAQLIPADVWSSFLQASPALPMSQQRRSRQLYQDIILSYLVHGDIPDWASELGLNAEVLADLFDRMVGEGSPLFVGMIRDLPINEAVLRRLRQLVVPDAYRKIIGMLDAEFREVPLLTLFDTLRQQVVAALPGESEMAVSQRIAELILLHRLWLLGPAAEGGMGVVQRLLESAFPAMKGGKPVSTGDPVRQIFRSGVALPEPGQPAFELFAGLVRMTVQTEAGSRLLEAAEVQALRDLLSRIAREQPRQLLTLFRLVTQGIGPLPATVFSILPSSALGKLVAGQIGVLPGTLVNLLKMLRNTLGGHDNEQLDLLILSELIMPDHLTLRAYSRFFKLLGSRIPRASEILSERLSSPEFQTLSSETSWIAPARLLVKEAAGSTENSPYLLPARLSADWEAVQYFLQYGSVSPRYGLMTREQLASALKALVANAPEFFRRQAYALVRHPFSRRQLIGLLETGPGIQTGFQLIHSELASRLQLIRQLINRTYPDFPFFSILTLDDPATRLDVFLRLWTTMPFLVMTPSSLIRVLLGEYAAKVKIPLRVLLAELEQQIISGDRMESRAEQPGKDREPTALDANWEAGIRGDSGRLSEERDGKESEGPANQDVQSSDQQSDMAAQINQEKTSGKEVPPAGIDWQSENLDGGGGVRSENEGQQEEISEGEAGEKRQGIPQDPERTSEPAQNITGQHHAEGGTRTERQPQAEREDTIQTTSQVGPEESAKKDTQQQEIDTVEEVKDLLDAEDSARAITDEPSDSADEGPPQDEAEGIYIGNAGLCLLWPFLGRLFRRLNMMDGKDFIDEETRTRAILLTEYLVRGSSPPDLASLTLNKILCGAEPAYAVDRDELEITPEEEALVESLLKGAIYNWEKVRGTKIETFQETFLQREGVLRKVEKQWVLTVESRAYDLLLMTLPWNLGMIKTAWMNTPLEVIWDHGAKGFN